MVSVLSLKGENLFKKGQEKTVNTAQKMFPVKIKMSPVRLFWEN